MGSGTERELSRPRRGPAGAGARPLVRRALWVAGTGLAFLVLALLGLGLASLVWFGDPVRPEPEAAPPPRSAPRPVAEPAPPPPRPPTPPPPAAAPPLPAPAVEPAQRLALPEPAIPLPTRLRTRRELLRGLGALKDELARCPTDPVTRTPPTSRAALVLDTVAEAGAVRVMSSHLEAEGPVNDRFVSCARSVVEGKRLVVSGTTPGAQLRLIIPIASTGNSLSLPAATLTQGEAN